MNFYLPFHVSTDRESNPIFEEEDTNECTRAREQAFVCFLRGRGMGRGGICLHITGWPVSFLSCYYFSSSDCNIDEVRNSGSK
jgi:hypothetical protein